MQIDHLVNSASTFVSGFLSENLSPQHSFHNLNHTLEVLQAVQTIGEQSNISGNELCAVEIAALFHDCGYAEVYTGHEDRSKKIASAFLTEHNCSIDL